MAWLGTWAHRLKVTIDHTKVASDLEYFPLMVYISASSGYNSKDLTSIFSEIGDADDLKIAMTSDDGTTQLYVEVDKWDTASQEAWLWVKVPAISSTVDTDLYLYYDNTQADNTDYVGELATAYTDAISKVWCGKITESATPSGPFLTDWVKSGALQTKTGQNWITTIYSNYGGEDMIYLFEQRDETGNGIDIHCWKIPRTYADDPTHWTDVGIVYTGTHTWEGAGVEPHSIVWETQAMADAREGVGAGLGTPKWRMYYNGRPAGSGSSEYGIGFLYADESDLTSWTYYASNPVYPHDASFGYADPVAFIYSGELWILLRTYSTNYQKFTHSTDGISGWSALTSHAWEPKFPCHGSIVPWDGSGNFMITGHDVSQGEYGDYWGYSSTNGEDEEDCYYNPILTRGTWDARLRWNSIVRDKNESPDIGGYGTYYMYYMADDDNDPTSVYQLGLATSTTKRTTKPVFTRANHFKKVYHMKDWGTGDIKSSSDGVVSSGSGTAGVGKIGDSIDYNGSQFAAHSDLPAQTEMTWEAWVHPNTGISSFGAIMGYLTNHITMRHHVAGNWQLYDNANGVYANTAAAILNTWQKVVGTIDSLGNLKIYLNNNAPVTDTGADASLGATSNYIAYDGSAKFYGMIDEIRIANVARSADWISTSYTSEIDNLLDFEFSAPPGPTVWTDANTQANPRSSDMDGSGTALAYGDSINMTKELIVDSTLTGPIPVKGGAKVTGDFAEAWFLNEGADITRGYSH